MIAESYERIHRSNLIGMGIVPLQFLQGQNAESLALTGKEQFSIDLTPEALHAPRQVRKMFIDIKKRANCLHRESPVRCW